MFFEVFQSTKVCTDDREVTSHLCDQTTFVSIYLILEDLSMVLQTALYSLVQLGTILAMQVRFYMQNLVLEKLKEVADSFSLTMIRARLSSQMSEKKVF